MVNSGFVIAPAVIPGIPSIVPIGPGPSGPLTTAHTTASPLPTSGGPTPAIMVPTIPPFMHGGIGPSTTIQYIPTIPVTTPIVKIQPYPPPFTHGNYIPVGTDTIVGSS